MRKIKSKQPKAPAQPESKRVALSAEQAPVFKELIQAKNEVEARLSVAIRALGFDPAMLAGGDVAGDDPHLVFRVMAQRPALVPKDAPPAEAPKEN